MTESQQFLMAALANMITVVIGVLINNSRLSDLRATMDQRFNSVDRRFDIMQAEMNRRFDESKDIWRSELHRVEEVLDARLKHLEELR
jgi:hypothetical protein